MRTALEGHGRVMEDEGGGRVHHRRGGANDGVTVVRILRSGGEVCNGPRKCRNGRAASPRRTTRLVAAATRALAMTIGNAGRDLLVHLMLLPVLEFLMTSPRVVGREGKGKAKQRGLMIAGCALLTVSAIKVGLELRFKEESFYDMMDVTPSAPATELKKGYKRASLKVHPDKLQATGEAAAEDEGSADEAFVALKAAYDVLSDSYQRDLYDKFGRPGLEHKNDTTALLAGLGFFYIISLMLAYMLTRRRTVGRAQTWAFTGLLALGIFEYQACILSFDFLQEALPQVRAPPPAMPRPLSATSAGLPCRPHCRARSARRLSLTCAREPDGRAARDV